VKRVCKSARITLGGEDISSWVISTKINAKVGELYTVDLEVLDGNWLSIEDKSRPSSNPAGTKITSNAEVIVQGSDISSHIFGYEFVRRAGEVDTVKLRVQADENVITFNGTTPWVES
jgi:hypothetical protein